ncbi:MAG: low affinity iron permease family protein [Chthoniobacterales bacterium]
MLHQRDCLQFFLTASQNQRCGCAQLQSQTRSIDIGANEQNGKPDQRDIFCKVRDAFSVFARSTSNVLGTAWAFVVAILIIVVWAVTGPTFHYSDTWQLIINTGTTIVTFLMVFLIQNTQNRDAKAVHLKLDELIRALKGARNKLVDLEKLSDDELIALEEQFTRLRKRAESTVDKADDAVEKVEHAAASR